MHEGDLFDWLSVAAVLAAAAGAGLAAARAPRRRGRFVLLAMILAFLAADDAFGLHEQVTRAAATALGVTARGDVLFLAPYLPLLAGAFLLLSSAARESPPSTGRTIRLGLGLLVAALGLRVLAAFVLLTGMTLSGGQRSLGRVALHQTELLAWVLVAAGLALYGARLRPRERQRPRGGG